MINPTFSVFPSPATRGTACGATVPLPPLARRFPGPQYQGLPPGSTGERGHLAETVQKYAGHGPLHVRHVIIYIGIGLLQIHACCLLQWLLLFCSIKLSSLPIYVNFRM